MVAGVRSGIGLQRDARTIWLENAAKNTPISSIESQGACGKFFDMAQQIVGNRLMVARWRNDKDLGLKIKWGGRRWGTVSDTA